MQSVKLKKIIRRIIKKEERKGKIDLSFIDDEEMRRLNRKFRKKNKPTDVLSFGYDEGPVLGDIIIAKEIARRNAARYGGKLMAEIKRLTIHGALHVLGYDHGRKMSRAEKIYAQL